MNQLFTDEPSSKPLFELQQDLPSIIKVIGVGGGGGNAVNHMYRQGIKGVDFLVCNTDAKALQVSPVPDKIQLGPGLTQGMGAGAVPEVGRQAVLESKEEILRSLGEHTRMAFITAGMGGGTGTGAAPIIAGIAKERGVLTVGIVTQPFLFEGGKRRKQAEAGIDEMKKNVDALIVICNDKLREIHGNLNISQAFGHADDVLAVAAKSIAEIITNTMHISTDFADIQTVMKDSGVAIMGSASAEGDNRAIRAAEAALDSPLLNDNVITGANYILLNITSGTSEVTMDEVSEINEYIQAQAGQTADIIMGIGNDPSLGSQVSVTIIATGFNGGQKKPLSEKKQEPEMIVHQLVEPTPVASPISLVPSAHAISVAEPETKVDPLEPVLIIRDVVEEESVVSPIEPDFKFELESESVFQFDPEPEPIISYLETPVSTQVSELEPVLIIRDEEASFMLEGEEVSEEEAMSPLEFRFELDFPVEPKHSDVVSHDEASVHVLSFDFPTAMDAPPMDEADELPHPMMEFDAPAFNEAVEPVRHDLYAGEVSPVQAERNEPAAARAPLSPEDEMYLHSRERIMRLKEVSMRINSPNGLADMEREPAYRRRNIKLDDVPPATESNVSRYTLSVEENRPEIRPNNPFLHDRVD
ncbi:MAG: cell division protein FtsZ [Bacteroidota bacterium]